MRGDGEYNDDHDEEYDSNDVDSGGGDKDYQHHFTIIYSSQ